MKRYLSARIGGCLAAIGLSLLLQAGAVPPSSTLFTEAPGSPLAVGSQPAAVAVGDENSDGKLDAIVANSGSDNVSVLLGDGRGGFRNAPQSPFAAGPKPHLVVLGDVNGDGALDLAVTEHDSNEVRVFLGLGDGRFRVARGSPFVALRSARPDNHGLTFTDVNHDGKLDITTSNQNDKSVSVLLGDGKGGFAPAPGSPFAVGGTPYPHALGDLNEDGALDIVTPNVQENSMGVLLGDGKGGFRAAPGSLYHVEIRPYHAELGDVNGDKHLDAVLTHDDITLVSVLLGDGHGGFRAAPASPADTRRRGGKVMLRDVNGDGQTDLITCAGGSVIVMLGDGRGGFTPAPGSPYATPGGSWGMDMGDFNGDGKLDIVTANSAGNSVTVLLGR